MSCFCKIMLLIGERGWALQRARPSLSPCPSGRFCLLCGHWEPGALGADVLGHTGTSPNLSGQISRSANHPVSFSSFQLVVSWRWVVYEACGLLWAPLP